MGKQRGKRVLGGTLRLSQLVLAGLLSLGCDRGGAAEVNADAQAPAVGRPDDATAGPRVGVVVIASADVRVQPSRGAAFPAKEGVMLVRDDRLVTRADPGSFVVVELFNGHLVRFNQGTEIAVEKIAVFDAPKAGEDLAQRFEKVLRPEELGDDKMRGAISRVAGWNSRMTASETIAVLPADHLRQAPPPLSDAKAEEPPGGGKLGAPVSRDDSSTRKEPESAPDASDPLDAPDRGGGGFGKQSKSPEEADKDVKAPSKNTRPSPSPDDGNDQGDTESSSKKKSEPKADKRPTDQGAPVADLPESVSFKPDVGPQKTIKLPLALSAERLALARCAGSGAQLRAHVVKGLIKEIEVSNGKRCTLEVSRGLSLPDGWLEMRVK